MLLIQDKTLSSRPRENRTRVVHGGGRWNMNLAWVMLGLVGWLLLVFFVFTLMRISGEQDRIARRSHKVLDPYCDDVTITRSGVG